MNVISTITILPSTEEEYEAYKRKLKIELLYHHNPEKLKKQIEFTRQAFDDILNDTDLWPIPKKE